MKSFLINLAVVCSVQLILLVLLPQPPVGGGGSSFVQLCSASGRIQQCVPREQEETCATSQVPLYPNIWQSMAMKFSGHEIIFLSLTSVNNRKVEFLTHKFYFVSLSPTLPLLGIYFRLPFSVSSHVTLTPGLWTLHSVMTFGIL